jgi:putative ABC transport system ATP-binding protein
VRALSGVNLRISGGEFVAIQGPSGSGKSTLLHMLGCMDRPTDGSITIDDIEVTTLADRKLTKFRLHKLGFIFQQFYLLPTLTARENVMLPMKEAGVGWTERRRRTEELLLRLGIDERADHYPSQLSGGEQQRAAIARALANNPKLLLADEPTGELDSANSKKIVGILRELNREKGLTIVMVTHNNAMAKMATRCIVMRDGKVSK